MGDVPNPKPDAIPDQRPRLLKDRELLASRRALLAVAGGLALLPLADALSDDPILGAANAADDADQLQAMIDAGDCTIERRSSPYLLGKPLHLPSDRVVRIEPGTRFVYQGGVGRSAAGVFLAQGNNIEIIVTDGGEASVETAAAAPFLYAVFGRAISGLQVDGIRAVNCQHVWIGGRSDVYGEIETAGDRAGISRNIRVRRGGARFVEPQTEGHGACYMAYTFGWQVAGSSYENVAHGVEWWGGDANPGRDGARANPRKCGDFRISDVLVLRAAGGGIWGSMGKNGAISRCRVQDCGDVGFDAEGSDEISFEACVSRDAANGCFATFFLCQGVRFVNCAGLVSLRSRPLFRMYNATQSHEGNGGISIIGGKFECTDRAGPAPIDTVAGPAHDFTIRNAEFNNARIDTAHFNMHRTVIADNLLRFPYPGKRFTAIRAGASKLSNASGTVRHGSAVVERNRIVSARPQAGLEPGHAYGEDGDYGSVAIELLEDDYNSSAVSYVRDNLISDGFFTGILAANGSANVGIVPTIHLAGNSLGSHPASGARYIHVVRKGSAANLPVVRWTANRTSQGTPIRQTN